MKPLRVRGWMRDLIEDARSASEAESGGDDARAFYHLAWWRKVIVMAVGPVVNLVIAVFLFTVVLPGIGVPTRRSQSAKPSHRASNRYVGVHRRGSRISAAKAGLEPGDTFVSVDGQSFSKWSDLTTYVAARPGLPLTVVVDRAGTDVTLHPRPPQGSARSRETPTRRRPWGSWASLGSGARAPTDSYGLVTDGSEHAQTFSVVAHLPEQLWHVARASVGLEQRSTPR